MDQEPITYLFLDHHQVLTCTSTSPVVRFWMIMQVGSKKIGFSIRIRNSECHHHDKSLKFLNGTAPMRWLILTLWAIHFSFDGSSPLLHQILLFVICSNPSKEANCQKGVSWRRFCFHEKGLATLFDIICMKILQTEKNLCHLLSGRFQGGSLG